MKILKSVTRKTILLILILVFSINATAFAESNLSRTQIEKIMDEIALKRAVPSVILKSVGWTESKLQQFNYDGSPKISGDCIGLMMINNNSGLYNSQKLKYDVRYNIEAGVDVLLNKWSMSSYNMVSSVGNMNPDVLENWYFALWAYNGWASSNNPNSLPSYVKTYTYQQLVYNVCKEQYNQNITNIDFAYLPESGKPSRSLNVPTPSNIHTANITLYDVGDYVRTDGARSKYALRDVPGGKYVKELSNNQLMTITEGPVLKNGYYWYKTYINDTTQGWIERNWLLRTGDIQSGRYVFEDIAFNWARKNIMELYNKGVISESTYYYPDEAVTKEEFSIMLSKALKLNNTLDNTTLPYSDVDKINSWALNHVINIYNAGFLKDFTGTFNPAENLTRKQAALILSNVFEEDQQYHSLDINTIFKDVSQLSINELSAVKEAYTQGLMSGKSSNEFKPDEILSRAEAAAIMTKAISKTENK